MTSSAFPSDPGSFFTKTSTALAVVSHAGVVLSANAAFAAAFDDEPVGREFTSLVAEAGRAHLEATLREAVASAPSALDLTTARGRTMHLEISRDDGAFLVTALSSRGTPRALAQREAFIAQKQAALDVLNCVLESAPLILWSTDTTPTMLSSEGNGLQRLGIPPGALVGVNALEMYKDAPEVGHGILRALKGEVVRSNTSPIPGVSFDNWMIPMRTQDGAITGCIGLAIDVTERALAEKNLLEKLAVIEQQNATIRELATPIINVWEGVLCLPVIGTVDSMRIAAIMETLLEAIVRESARVAIVDLTGVEVVDTATADHLIRLLRAARMLGAHGVVCGIRPAVAHTVVTLGVSWEGITIKRSLQEALEWCIDAQPRN
jgi:rsbT co-antagonist protein RsbR